MSSKEQKFGEFYQRAKESKQRGNYEQARKEYITVLNNFKISEIDFVDYVVVMSELGDCQRYMGLFNESKSRYIQGLSYLDKANQSGRKVSEYENKKEKYHLLSNLALSLIGSLIGQTEKIQNKLTDIQLVSEINSAISNLKKCQQIVVTMIVQNKNQNEEKQEYAWWKKQYLGLTVNIAETLSVEAFEFMDKNIMQLMIELIQRGQKFYNLCKKKTKRIIQSNLNKCFYYKAICLKFLGNIEQSEIYFKKDYKNCQQNKLKDDLEKTRVQMVKFYRQIFKFKEAKLYALKTFQKELINAQQKSFIELMRRAKQIEGKVGQGISINNDELQDILYDLHEKKCNEQSLQFNMKMRGAKQFREDRKFRYWLFYYAAEVYFALNRYDDTIKSLNEACRLAQNEAKQIAWCSLLWALILDRTQKDRSKVEQAFQKCIKQSKSSDQDCKLQCQKQYDQFKLREKRSGRKSELRFDTKWSDKLFNYMNEVNMRAQRLRQERMQMEEQIESQIIEDNLQQDFYRPQRKILKQQLNPSVTYVENCKLLNIEPIEQFKELLRNPKQIDLEKFIYFQPQQILALTNSSTQIQVLDLTSVVLNFLLIKKFQEKINLKSLKINLINASTLQSKLKAQIYQQFYQLLKVNVLMENLNVTNLYQSQQLLKIIQAKDILAFQSLTVLKLKQCQIEDKDLIFLAFGQHLPQLKKLSLSKNRLKGKTLDALTGLQQLQSLSLSSNPLTEANLSRDFQSLKLISLNNLSDSIPSQSYGALIRMMISCEKIKMKNCQKVCTSLLSVWIESILLQQTSVSCLREMILFGSILREDILIVTLERFKRNAPNLTLIDLRNCKIPSSENDASIRDELHNLEFAFKQSRHSLSRDIFNHQTSRTIKTANLKFIHPSNPKGFKSFSIN